MRRHVGCMNNLRKFPAPFLSSNLSTLNPAFHRVPNFFSSKKWDAVEVVPTWNSGAMRSAGYWRG